MFEVSGPAAVTRSPEPKSQNPNRRCWSCGGAVSPQGSGGACGSWLSGTRTGYFPASLSTLHPAPCTPHPAPYTPTSESCTTHPTPTPQIITSNPQRPTPQVSGETYGEMVRLTRALEASGEDASGPDRFQLRTDEPETRTLKPRARASFSGLACRGVWLAAEHAWFTGVPLP